MAAKFVVVMGWAEEAMVAGAMVTGAMGWVEEVMVAEAMGWAEEAMGWVEEAMVCIVWCPCTQHSACTYFARAHH